MTQKTTHPTKDAKAPRRSSHENGVDANRGEPLAMRAQKRRAELQLALDKLPVEDLRARNDIEIAMSSIDGLLTGDPDHLSDVTAADLSRLLESSKHLAETTPRVRPRLAT